MFLGWWGENRPVSGQIQKKKSSREKDMQARLVTSLVISRSLVSLWPSFCYIIFKSLSVDSPRVFLIVLNAYQGLLSSALMKNCTKGKTELYKRKCLERSSQKSRPLLITCNWFYPLRIQRADFLPLSFRGNFFRRWVNELVRFQPLGWKVVSNWS